MPPNLVPGNQPQDNISTQVHHDLTMRARGGIVMYAVVWLMLVCWADIHQITPFSFWLNTSLFVFVAFLRALHFLLHIKQPLYHVELMYRWLIFLVLFSALHWGIMTAWVIGFSPYEQLRYPSMIIMAAFAVGGTATLSISTSIRKTYSLLIFSPTIFIEFLHRGGGTENTALSIMAILSVLYVLNASAASSRDYYSAITNHELAEQRAAKLEILSITDSLTQLKNRMYFDNRFNKEWKRCDRSHISLCVMMIDLDYFKRINDQYGHVCGDLCLQSIAQILTQVFPRETDTVARYGGEEFVVLLPNTGLSDAQNIATKLLQRISQTEMTCNQHALSITCSIGIACTLPDHQINHESLLMAADNAMYNAKENGRNQWRVGSIDSRVTGVRG